jgi:hypothetical protein
MTGTTAVVVAAAPAAAKLRFAHDGYMVNLDTVDHSFSFFKLKGATSYALGDPVLVAAGKSGQWSGTVDLVSTDEFLTASIEAAHITTAPKVIMSIKEWTA